MGYKIEIPGFEGQNIEIIHSMWNGSNLFVNGQPAGPGPKRGEIRLRTTDGTETIATWRPQFIGLDVPQLMVNGQIIQAVKPLAWYQWAWIVWPPVALLFSGPLGGIFGAFLGVLAIYFNIKILRSSLSNITKYIATAVVSAAMVVLYIAIDLMIRILADG